MTGLTSSALTRVRLPVGERSSLKSPQVAPEIRHINKDDKGLLKGLYLIGLSILESQNSNRVGAMKVAGPNDELQADAAGFVRELISRCGIEYP